MSALVHHPAAVAVENDYDLLVHSLNELTDMMVGLRDEVERRLLDEKRDGLDPNTLKWLNLIFQRIPYVPGIANNLRNGVEQVLLSSPGQPVFKDQPPPPPDAPD